MIIGITGKIGSGKSTVSNYMADAYGFKEYSFASPLKQIGEIFGFTHTELYGTQEQKLEKNEVWGVSARDFLQKVGTELFRDKLQEVLPHIKVKRGLWSDMFRKKYETHPGLYVISDVRFLDEYQTIKDLGGVVIRVNRNETVNKGGEEHKHRSETVMDCITPDFIILNNGSLHDLKIQIDSIVTYLK